MVCWRKKVYVRQPPGFESEKYPHRVYKLRKALYGLKQAAKVWYGRLRGFLFERGFEIGKVDQTLFLLRQGRDILIVMVYMDEEGEHVDQKEYRSMIGSLLYLMATRPDIQFSVCLCALFQASPRTSHRQAVKRIFRYLRHTPDFGLWYSASSSLALHGFSDADFAGCRLDRKSTSGTCQFLGSSLVSWSSRKQSSVAQSTTEAEYVAAASCCSQLLWITYTMSDFGEEYTHVPLRCDSTSAISIAKNQCSIPKPST
jgi:hypothetical protein